MRKFVNYFVIALAFVFAGCNSQEGPFNPEEPTPDEPQIHGDPEREYVALMEVASADTKTFLDGTVVKWSPKDEIAVFEKNTNEFSRFLMKDKAEATTNATFSYVSGRTVTGGPYQDNVAVYPYNDGLTCMDEGTPGTYILSNIIIPQRQTFVHGNSHSFDTKSFPMAAVVSGDVLYFKNICGLIRLRLTGNATITQVKLVGNNNEAISGSFSAMVSRDGFPSLMYPTSLDDPESLHNTIILDCGTGVTLNDNTPTEFTFIVPAMEYASGFSFVITGNNPDGITEMALSTKQTQTIKRSVAKNMQSKAFVKQSIITYTTYKNRPFYVNPKVSIDFWNSVYNDEDKHRIFLLDNSSVLDDGAFSGCQTLETISLPETYTTLRDYVFNNNINLTSVSLPNTISSIGTGAFNGCRSLTSIDLPDALTVISSDLFAYCSNLKNVILPYNLLEINSYAFQSTRIENMTLPSTVKVIGDGAFMGCSSLKSITLEENIRSIGGSAFRDCPSLKTVTILATNPPTLTGDDTFLNSPNCVIKVPASKVEVYKAAWPLYQDKIQSI